MENKVSIIVSLTGIVFVVALFISEIGGGAV